MIKVRMLLALCIGAAAVPVALVAQERGSVTGVVVEGPTQRPLPGVQVSVAGTQLGTLTNQEGRYLIVNVPAGTREVRATRIGYAQGTQQVTVMAGEVATADFALAESAVALEGLVVTATGEVQRVRERGNVVAQIPVAEMDLAPITTMSDVLQGRSSGVVVQRSSGTTGAGSRVRIRGSTSASLGNQPLLIIDGIRVNESPVSFSIGLGGQSPSRLEDINPEDIESIEILKGAAATSIYGAAAGSAGAILITTRRGQAGRTRWSFRTTFQQDEALRYLPMQQMYGIGANGQTPAGVVHTGCRSPSITAGSAAPGWSRRTVTCPGLPFAPVTASIPGTPWAALAPPGCPPDAICTSWSMPAARSPIRCGGCRARPESCVAESDGCHSRVE
jgi:TonB-dependent SusC/RagA subfamily outer membrane receptor